MGRTRVSLFFLWFLLSALPFWISFLWMTQGFLASPVKDSVSFPFFCGLCLSPVITELGRKSQQITLKLPLCYPITNIEDKKPPSFLFLLLPGKGMCKLKVIFRLWFSQCPAQRNCAWERGAIKTGGRHVSLPGQAWSGMKAGMRKEIWTPVVGLCRAAAVFQAFAGWVPRINLDW